MSAQYKVFYMPQQRLNSILFGGSSNRDLRDCTVSASDRLCDADARKHEEKRAREVGRYLFSYAPVKPGQGLLQQLYEHASDAAAGRISLPYLVRGFNISVCEDQMAVERKHKVKRPSADVYIVHKELAGIAMQLCFNQQSGVSSVRIINESTDGFEVEETKFFATLYNHPHREIPLISGFADPGDVKEQYIMPLQPASLKQLEDVSSMAVELLEADTSYQQSAGITQP